MSKGKRRRPQEAARDTYKSTEARASEAKVRLEPAGRPAVERGAGLAVSSARPPFVRRAIAFGLDWYVGGVLTALPVMAALHLADVADSAVMDVTQLAFPAALATVALSTMLALLYYVVVPWRLNGQTFGKKLVGVRIAPREGGTIGMGRLLFRQVFGIMIVEGSVYMITALVLQVACWSAPEVHSTIVGAQYAVTASSVVLVVLTARRTALHDMFARTEVVRV